MYLKGVTCNYAIGHHTCHHNERSNINQDLTFIRSFSRHGVYDSYIDRAEIKVN
jgi:hypothetical protein